MVAPTLGTMVGSSSSRQSFVLKEEEDSVYTRPSFYGSFSASTKHSGAHSIKTQGRTRGGSVIEHLPRCTRP